MIKKIAALACLMMFIGSTTMSFANVSTDTYSVEYKKEKCKECGSKKCDGKCEVKAEEKKACCSKGEKGVKSEATSCCAKKEATAKNTSAKKETKKACCSAHK